MTSAFPWAVTYGIRAGSVIQCGLKDTTPQSGPQSGQHLHSWGGVVTYGIRAGLVTPCGLRDTTHKVGPNEVVRDLSEGDCDAPI